MYKRLFSAALVFGAAALAPPVLAQGQNCMARDALVQKLTETYKEQLVGGGLQNARQLLEIWTSGTTGSFTVLITRPDGQSCVVATGNHWMGITLPAPEGVTG